GDDAVLHRLDGDNVAGGAAEHFLGFLADGFHVAVVLVDGDDGGLVHDDAAALRVNQRVRRSQVDGQVAGEHAEQRANVVKARVRMETIRWHTSSLLPVPL